jgi:hypothetical protein
MLLFASAYKTALIKKKSYFSVVLSACKTWRTLHLTWIAHFTRRLVAIMVLLMTEMKYRNDMTSNDVTIRNELHDNRSIRYSDVSRWVMDRGCTSRARKEEICEVGTVKITQVYIYTVIVISSRDGVVGIATSYELDDRGVGVRIPVGWRIFSSPNRPDRLWGPHNLLSSGYRGFFPRG